MIICFRILIIGVISLIFISGTKINFNPDQVIGKWKSANNKQIVQVYYDPSKSCYNGRVTWMAEDDSAKGTRLCDVKNPDPALRKRRLTGINLLLGFKYSGKREYLGKVYDPVKGKNYKCKITMSKDAKIAYMRGYILVPVMGRTLVTNRVIE